MTCSVFLLSSFCRSSSCRCTFSRLSFARCNSASSSSSSSMPLLDDELGRDSLLIRLSWINSDSSFTISDSRPIWKSHMTFAEVNFTVYWSPSDFWTKMFAFLISSRHTANANLLYFICEEYLIKRQNYETLLILLLPLKWDSNPHTHRKQQVKFSLCSASFQLHYSQAVLA